MRPLSLDIAPMPGARLDPTEAALIDALKSIADNSHLDNATQITRDFGVSNFTETRSLDASAATLADVANFVCTLVSDLKKGGSKASQ